MIKTVKPSFLFPDTGFLRGWILSSILFVGLWPAAGLASANIALMCDKVAQVAAAESGVPLAVLRSITRTETGRTRDGTLQPWPWTVNMEGIGKWFDTEDAARAYVFKHFKRGARSFDVGCFQINYKWHHEAFRSIDEMFDPLTNARYAANFLKRLHQETGDWSKAAGAYHSRTPEFATKYRSRFDRIRRDMQAQPPVIVANAVSRPIAASQNRLRINTFPLLQPGSNGGTRGSLVPLEQGTGQALIGLAQPQLGS